MELTKIYDFNGNFKGLDNYKILEKFLDDKGEFRLNLKPNSISKKEMVFLTNMVGLSLVLKGQLALASSLGTNAVAVSTTYGLKQNLWDKLLPFAYELMDGADVVILLVLIYCGLLLSMGQVSKGKKIFKCGLEGYFLMRLSPIIVHIVANITKSITNV